MPDTLAYRAAKFLRRRSGAVAAVGVIAALMLAGVLIVNREARLANDQLRIDLAVADARIGLLYVAQRDLVRAAAAYAEAERIAGALASQAGSAPALDALRAEMKELEADLASPNPQ